jgi:hypothetical protein
VLGFPIRTSPDHSQVGDSPRLNAASHVLHRLLMPRHPPCALKNLATKDARVHYANLKQQPENQPKQAPNPAQPNPAPQPGHQTRPRKRYTSRPAPDTQTTEDRSQRPRHPQARGNTPQPSPHHPPQSRGTLREPGRVRSLRTQQCVPHTHPNREDRLPTPGMRTPRAVPTTPPATSGCD